MGQLFAKLLSIFGSRGKCLCSLPRSLCRSPSPLRLPLFSPSPFHTIFSWLLLSRPCPLFPPTPASAFPLSFSPRPSGFLLFPFPFACLSLFHSLSRSHLSPASFPFCFHFFLPTCLFVGWFRLLCYLLTYWLASVRVLRVVPTTPPPWIFRFVPSFLLLHSASFHCCFSPSVIFFPLSPLLLPVPLFSLPFFVPSSWSLWPSFLSFPFFPPLLFNFFFLSPSPSPFK